VISTSNASDRPPARPPASQLPTWTVVGQQKRLAVREDAAHTKASDIRS